MNLHDTVETYHSESTAAKISSSKIDNECNKLMGTAPSEEIKPSSKDPTNKIKKIRFAGVSVREYTVVVGCQNISCPLELDWEYVEHNFAREEDYRYSVNSGPRSKLRRLSYKERKHIIAVSQDVAISQVKYLEQEMIDLQRKILECENFFSLDWKRYENRIDFSRRSLQGDNGTLPRPPPTAAATTTTSSNIGILTTKDAMMIGSFSNNIDSIPRRPCHIYD